MPKQLRKITQINFLAFEWNIAKLVKHLFLVRAFNGSIPFIPIKVKGNNRLLDFTLYISYTQCVRKLYLFICISPDSSSVHSNLIAEELSNKKKKKKSSNVVSIIYVAEYPS